MEQDFYLRPMEPHYLEPDLYFWGLRITEFSIALTSVLVALVCLYAWLRLRRQHPAPEIRLFRIFLILMGISTLIGGVVGHAFLYCLPFIFKTPGWVLGMLAVAALGQTCILRARPRFGPAWFQSLTVLNLLALLVATFFVFITLWFPLVEAHSAFCMLLLVGGLESWNYVETRQRSSLYFLYAILFAVAAACAHVAKISLGTWITFFDIGHLMMAGTIWMILRAAEISTTEKLASIKVSDK